MVLCLGVDDSMRELMRVHWVSCVYCAPCVASCVGPAQCVLRVCDVVSFVLC